MRHLLVAFTAKTFTNFLCTERRVEVPVLSRVVKYRATWRYMIAIAYMFFFSTKNCDRLNNHLLQFIPKNLKI